jgi:hypothetical protein
MPEAIDLLFTQFVDQQQEFAALTGETNWDIYQHRLTEPDPSKYPEYRKTPCSMYFYYVRVDWDGGLVADHYFYANGDEADPSTWQPILFDRQGLTDIVTKLARNARPSGGYLNPPRLSENHFKGIKWRYKSYIAIFLDEALWSFRKQGSGDAAVTFVVDEGTKKGTPNHSFFDGIDLSIRPSGPTGDERSAIVFVNHMKGDDSGRDLGDKENQHFIFKMIFDVKFSTGQDAPMIVIFDPGGDNEGPPLPPP